MSVTPKKFVRNIPVKAKCPFPSTRTLSQTFPGLYSQFQFAFEKLLRQCLFVSSEYSLQSFSVCFEVRSDNLR